MGLPARTRGAILAVMRIEQTFTVASSPESVFDYVTDLANLRDWQTSKTRVEPLTDGPPRRVIASANGQGRLARESSSRSLNSPSSTGPTDCTYTSSRDHFRSMADCSSVTRVTALASTSSPRGRWRGLMRVAGPITRLVMDRQFAKYHENLRRNVESRS
jgi:hypothetical protein